jgi:hypothetical protein
MIYNNGGGNLAGKMPPMIEPERELDILRHIKIWWDPIPIDWWMHLKVEQKVAVMRQQVMVARARIKADVAINNAQLAALDAIEKSLM